MKRFDRVPNTKTAEYQFITQHKYANRTVKFILWAGLFVLGVFPLSGQAQELSAADSAEIQRKAIRHVRQFEGLLNLVAQPDKYFRKYSFAKLIRSFYEEQSDYQIFRDSLVAIEDDLNPKAQSGDDNFLTIKDYLKAFFSFYEKSPVASVFFSDYQATAIKQAEFTYVEVFYLSEFTNRHRAYPELSYPLRYQKATLRAQRQEGAWQVVISNINVEQPGEELVASLTGGTASFSEATYLAESSNLALPSDGKVSSPVVSPSNEPLVSLSEGLVDSSRAWQIPARLDRGSDYQLRHDIAPTLRGVDYLPLVDAPAAENITSSAPGNTIESFKNFAPQIRKVGDSSVQVIFDNPVNNSLTVKLLDMDRRVLFSEKAAGQQHYAESIELNNLDEGPYLVNIVNEDYDHTVRIDYRLPKTDADTEEPDEMAFSKFKPYVMKKDGQPSVQVVFKNPANSPIAVALTDTRGRVLYSATVAGQQSYARSISLRHLPPGAYRIKIAHDRYQRTVRISH